MGRNFALRHILDFITTYEIAAALSGHDLRNDEGYLEYLKFADSGLSEIDPYEEEGEPRIANISYPVSAEIVKGVWTVECPICGSRFIVRRLYDFALCSRCNRGSSEGSWLYVFWREDMARVEHVLLARPKLGQRNALSGEDLQGLYRENAEHVNELLY